MQLKASECFKECFVVFAGRLNKMRAGEPNAFETGSTPKSGFYSVVCMCVWVCVCVYTIRMWRILVQYVTFGKQVFRPHT